MPDIQEYVLIKEAEADPRVPYSDQWIRNLVKDGRVEGKKIGVSHRGQWLVHMPSLLAYVEEMEELGTKKHRH